MYFHFDDMDEDRDVHREMVQALEEIPSSIKLHAFDFMKMVEAEKYRHGKFKDDYDDQKKLKESVEDVKTSDAKKDDFNPKEKAMDQNK